MFGPKSEATTTGFEQSHGKDGGARAPLGEPILELLGASAWGEPGEVSVRDVSFSVSPGEVFGLAGVDGNGQKQLAELLAGQRRLDGGDIRLGGESIAGLSIAQRQGLGLRYVTDDRLGEVDRVVLVHLALAKLFNERLPQAIEAACALLGSMILDWRVCGEVVQILSSGDDFYERKHGALFGVLYRRGSHRCGRGRRGRRLNKLNIRPLRCYRVWLQIGSV